MRTSDVFLLILALLAALAILLLPDLPRVHGACIRGPLWEVHCAPGAP